MSPQPLPRVPKGRWATEVREVEKAVVRAEVDDLVQRTGRHPVDALIRVYEAASECVVDQTLRGGYPGSREAARLRGAGALLRELRASRHRDSAA